MAATTRLTRCFGACSGGMLKCWMGHMAPVSVSTAARPRLDGLMLGGLVATGQAARHHAHMVARARVGTRHLARQHPAHAPSRSYSASYSAAPMAMDVRQTRPCPSPRATTASRASTRTGGQSWPAYHSHLQGRQCQVQGSLGICTVFLYRSPATAERPRAPYARIQKRNLLVMQLWPGIPVVEVVNVCVRAVYAEKQGRGP